MGMKETLNIKSKLLAEETEERILKYITNTPLQLGTKLPNEFELGEKFGVGRSTIREAVKLLVSKGVLEVRRGSGTYVISTTPVQLDPLGLQGLEGVISLARDLVDVRMMIETGIAELAASHVTECDIQKLRELCKEMEKKIKNGENPIPDDIAFHTFIAECSKNKVAKQLISILDTAALTYGNITHELLREECIATHQAIVDALADHDSVGARAAMMMHMTYSRMAIKKVKNEL